MCFCYYMLLYYDHKYTEKDHIVCQLIKFLKIFVLKVALTWIGRPENTLCLQPEYTFAHTKFVICHMFSQKKVQMCKSVPKDQCCAVKMHNTSMSSSIRRKNPHQNHIYLFSNTALCRSLCCIFILILYTHKPIVEDFTVEGLTIHQLDKVNQKVM